MVDLIGQVLAEKYCITKQLGEGGMGAVYLATHLGTDRPVALKVITSEYMAEPTFLERFRREAKAAGRLHHANVVNVTDFGLTPWQNSQLAYLVMEYLEGSTLGDLIAQQKRLSIGLTVDIIEQIALAIDAAHHQGIVHRDLKPDNVWLQPNGRGGYNVKVLDFGLAKIFTPTQSLSQSPQLIISANNSNSATANLPTLVNAADLEAATIMVNPVGTSNLEGKTITTQPLEPLISNSTLEAKTLITQPLDSLATLVNVESASDNIAQSDNKIYQVRVNTPEPVASLTQVGAILGTPHYMSPEQCLGQSLDNRTDIYSLGIIAYEMLTGEIPFKGRLREVLDGHVKGTIPPIHARFSDISLAVEQVILTAVAKDPALRPPTACAFAAGLQANAQGEQPLLSAAFDLYRQHFTYLMRGALALYLPYLIINYLWLVGSNYIFKAHTAKFWLMPLGTLIISWFINSLNRAAFVPLVRQLLATKEKIALTTNLKAFYRQWPRLCLVTIYSDWKIFVSSLKLILPGLRAVTDQALATTVMFSEYLSTSATIARSQTLVARFRPAMMAIQVRSFFVSVIALLAAPICLVLLSLFGSFIGKSALDSFTAQHPQLLTYLVVPLILSVITTLVLMLAYTYVGLANALYYFKCCQIGAEVSNSAQELPLLPKFKWVNRLLPGAAGRNWALGVLLVILLTGWMLSKDIALLVASSHNLTPMTNALLIVGTNANGNPQNPFTMGFNSTPLINAISNRDTELAVLLLNQGANIDASNSYGWTSLLEAVKQDNSDMIEMLVDRGANVNAQDASGWTVLMYAADVGNREVVEYLLTHGANPQLANQEGATPLIIAINGGQAYTIKPLLDKGADVNAHTKEGWTPLMAAVSGGDSFLVKLLLDKGANIKAQNSEGLDALTIAKDNDDEAIIKLLTLHTTRLALKD